MAISCRSAVRCRYGSAMPFGGVTGELTSWTVHMSSGIPVERAAKTGQRVHDRKGVRFPSPFPRDCPAFSAG